MATETKQILILGATGRTGQWLVREALERGYQVHALVRPQSTLPISHERLTVFRGSPLDEQVLDQALAGCVAALSALNISRKKEWWLWSELSAAPTLMSDAMRQLVKVGTRLGVRRLLVVTAWGVAETKKDLPGWFRWIINNTQIGVTYQDHERQEEVLEQSATDWTIVRPVGLTNRDQPVPVQVLLDTHHTKPKLTISRRMTARFMLDCLEKGQYLHQKPVIFEA